MSLETKTRWFDSKAFAVGAVVANVVLTVLALLDGAPIGRFFSGLVIGYYGCRLMWWSE